MANKRQEIVEVAQSLVGFSSLKYVYNHPEVGLTPETGFDCSGFVRFVLNKAGVHVPNYFGQDGGIRSIRHTNEFWDHFGVFIDPEAGIYGGDLVFMSRHGGWPSHMGIMVDPETYIHSPGSTGAKVEMKTVKKSAIEPKWPGRQLYATNPIGYKTPVEIKESPTYRYQQRPLPIDK